MDTKKNVVYRMKKDRSSGMYLPSDLHHVMMHSAKKYEKELPFLFARSSDLRKSVKHENLEGYMKDLHRAGEIILTKPLVKSDNGLDLIQYTVLDTKYSQTYLAIRIATLIELCGECDHFKSGLSILAEKDSDSHRSLFYENKLRQRDATWRYEPGSKSVMDPLILQFS